MLRAIELQNINIQKAFAEIDVPYNMLYSNLSDEKFKKHIVRRMTNEFAKLIEENISFNRDIKTRTNEKTGGVTLELKCF
jgi:Cu/Ag efflux pump CusA